MTLPLFLSRSSLPAIRSRCLLSFSRSNLKSTCSRHPSFVPPGNSFSGISSFISFSPSSSAGAPPYASFALQRKPPDLLCRAPLCISPVVLFSILSFQFCQSKTQVLCLVKQNRAGNIDNYVECKVECNDVKANEQRAIKPAASVVVRGARSRRSRSGHRYSDCADGRRQNPVLPCLCPQACR